MRGCVCLGGFLPSHLLQACARLWGPEGVKGPALVLKHSQLVKGDMLYRDGVRDGSPSRGVREDPPEKRRGNWARAGVRWTEGRSLSKDQKVRLQ